MQDPFWMIRRYIEMRNPELLPELDALMREPRRRLAHEFLDKYFPVECSWGEIGVVYTQDLLYSRYPNGVAKNEHDGNIQRNEGEQGRKDTHRRRSVRKNRS